MRIGVLVERRGEGLDALAGQALQLPQEPDPFVMMPGLDDVTHWPRLRRKAVGQIFAQRSGPLLEEARREQFEHPHRVFAIDVASGRLKERQERLQEMHVRVLAPDRIW